MLAAEHRPIAVVLGFHAPIRAIERVYELTALLVRPIERSGHDARALLTKLHRVVSPGCAKMRAPGVVAAVKVGAGVDQDRLSAKREPKRERVRVAMGGNFQIAERTMIKSQYGSSRRPRFADH